MTEHFAVVICHVAPDASAQSIFGKIGPFDNARAAAHWCYDFRKFARAENVDITAIPNEELTQVSTEVGQRNYLPSRDPREIINHAVVSSVIQF